VRRLTREVHLKKEGMVAEQEQGDRIKTLKDCYQVVDVLKNTLPKFCQKRTLIQVKQIKYGEASAKV
jgi:hypothetical protein